ncbi:hypothetical protein JNW90_30445 [Micromonospora sp. STR1s_5]|nr:hypothetical protein [Micromonospora sp. STR1s_5]
MTSDEEHTLIFKAVSGVTVQEAGETVAIEFAGSSGQTISVVIPAEASHTLSRMLMRAQIEAAATRGVAEGRASAVLPVEAAYTEPGSDRPPQNGEMTHRSGDDGDQ